MHSADSSLKFKNINNHSSDYSNKRKTVTEIFNTNIPAENTLIYNFFKEIFHPSRTLKIIFTTPAESNFLIKKKSQIHPSRRTNFFFN